MTGWGGGVMEVGEGVNLGMEGYVVWSGLRVGDGGCADCTDINPASHYYESLNFYLRLILLTMLLRQNLLHKIALEYRCEFDLLFYHSQSQANWSRKNGQALPAVRGEISNTEI